MTDTHMEALRRIEAGQNRVEAKLDQLLEALAEDSGEPAPQTTLEGEGAGRERDQSQSLDPSDPK